MYLLSEQGACSTNFLESESEREKASSRGAMDKISDDDTLEQVVESPQDPNSTRKRPQEDSLAPAPEVSYETHAIKPMCKPHISMT